MKLRIHIDGGSRGNPGPAAAAAVIFDADSGKLLHEAGYFLGRTTNNVAEYHGLLRALDLARALKADSIEIFSDSELMVRQINGQYKVKSPDLQPLFAKARQTLDDLAQWKMEHVYRARNARADELANRALDRGGDVVVKSMGAAAHDEAGGSAPEPDVAEETSSASLVKWTVALVGSPTETCPSRSPASQSFAFDGVTPAGLCVYAAQAALAVAPLADWPASKPRLSTTCPRCGRMIRIQRGS